MPFQIGPNPPKIRHTDCQSGHASRLASVITGKAGAFAGRAMSQRTGAMSSSRSGNQMGTRKINTLNRPVGLIGEFRLLTENPANRHVAGYASAIHSASGSTD